MTSKDETPPVPDDVADLLLAEMCSDEYQNLDTEKQRDHVLHFIRAASTPSAAPSKVTVEYGMMLETMATMEKEVKALRKIPLSASTSGDFIAPDYIKGWNAAVDAMTSKSVINNVVE